jgi:hypothetical protein
VDNRGLGQADGLKDRGSDVDAVRELVIWRGGWPGIYLLADGTVTSRTDCGGWNRFSFRRVRSCVTVMAWSGERMPWTGDQRKGRPMTQGDVVQGPLQAGSPLRAPGAAAVAGIVFSVLLTAAFVLLRLSVPADPRVAGIWLTDPGRRATVEIALNLIPFCGIAFLWFIGVIRDRVGQREDRFFATVFLGSGLLFVAMLFAAAAV